MKKKLIIILLALHLLIIYAGTSLFDFGRLPVYLRGPIAYYLSLVGGHDYSFFSPDIPTQFIVRCDIRLRSGQNRTVNFDRSDNTFKLKSSYLFQILGSNNDFETAATIAARYCHDHDADARSVKVTISTYTVPPSAAYLAGTEASLSELYSKDFIYE